MSRGGEKIVKVRVETVTQSSLQLIRWWEVVTFYSLRLAMAPVIEAVILLDRYPTFITYTIPGPQKCPPRPPWGEADSCLRRQI